MIGQDLRNIREQLGLSQKAFADQFGVNLRSLSRYETGQATPRGVTLRHLEKVLVQARALLTPGESLEPPRLEDPSQDEAGSGLGHLQEADLLLAELGAWVHRTVMRRPEALEQISSGVRRLINEVEGISEPTADTAEQNKDSPRKVAWGPNGEGG